MLPITFSEKNIMWSKAVIHELPKKSIDDLKGGEFSLTNTE